MLILYILNAIIILQLAAAIYNYSGTKETSEDDYDTENVKNISLTVIVLLSIFLLLINYLYIFNIINYKRTIFNFILLSVISSSLLLINYNYLVNQSKSDPGYEVARQNLEDVTNNTNKNIKDFNIIVSLITVSITLLILSFFVGYQYFSKETIKKIKEPMIVENYKRKKKRDIARLKLF